MVPKAFRTEKLFAALPEAEKSRYGTLDRVPENLTKDEKAEAVSELLEVRPNLES